MKKQWRQKKQVLTAKTLTHKYTIYIIRFQYINQEPSKQQTSTVKHNIPFQKDPRQSSGRPYLDPPEDRPERTGNSRLGPREDHS